MGRVPGYLIGMNIVTQGELPYEESGPIGWMEGNPARCSILPIHGCSLGPVPLRLIVGYGFMEHGLAKLSKGPDAFAVILHALNVPAPHLMAWATILIEVLGGFAVLLGAFVALISFSMATLLVVGIFTVHLPYGFSSIKLMAVTAAGAQFGKLGFECDLLYLALLRPWSWVALDPCR